MAVLHHMGITVSNIDSASAFYRDVTGGTIDGPYEKSGPAVDAVTGFTGVTLFLTFINLGGETVLELAEYRSGSGEAISPETNRPGVAHPAITVIGLESLLERVSDMGYRCTAEPKTATSGPLEGYRYVYVLGPDDLRVEFLEKPHLPTDVQPPSTATH
jgi:catechol 2,3-dioxygenase-like lactoylglutathione lyase family enzyme